MFDGERGLTGLGADLGSVPKKLTKVDFTNLDKELYPAKRITKAQVVEYYIRMAPRMLDMLNKRPLMLTRFPNGVDKQGFYEKDAPMGTPTWVETFKRHSETAKRDINYIVCSNFDTLIWLANMAALELHMTLSTADSWETPDLVLFDMDPEPPATFDDAIESARLLREKLVELGLRSYIKTSGKKGLHVVVPIIQDLTFHQTRDFVHKIAKILSKESKIVVSEFSRSKDPGTIFIDYRQNSHGRTMICPYSLRATHEATVSTPLDWKDVKKGLKPNEFNLTTVVKIEKEPWKGLFEDKQKLMVD